MKDELLQQIEALIDDPVPLLNLPTEDLIRWADASDKLCRLCEDKISGGPVIRDCHFSNDGTDGVYVSSKSIAAQIEGGVDAPY